MDAINFQIRWQDIVDITLNSYILFRFYVIFRGTRIFNVLIGIISLWFLQKITISQGLIVTSWLFQGITAVAALVIIVVFRNEIYAVLQTKNLYTLLLGFPQVNKPIPQDIIIDSIYEMASKRCGAIIVFPGKEDIKGIVQSGTQINGSISKELILSLFWKNNPVHDGAMIIQGNQIKEVGVILPLSSRQDLPSYYGTRHRAGIGLSESSDAFVIMVSEERGTILAAKGSDITKIYQREGLANLLDKHMGIVPENVKRKFFKKIEIPIAAIISLLFITSIWFSFTRKVDSVIALEIPIRYINQKQMLQIVETSTNFVRLHLGGSEQIIRTIRPEQIQVELNLQNISLGTTTIIITRDDIRVPPGIIVEGVFPSSITIQCEKIITKELPVQIAWEGRLSDNLILESVSVYPEKLMIIGWSKVLDNISTVFSTPVPLDKLNKSGMIMIKPILEKTSLKLAPGNSDTIKVVYTIKQRMQEVNNLPVSN